MVSIWNHLSFSFSHSCLFLRLWHFLPRLSPRCCDKGQEWCGRKFLQWVEGFFLPRPGPPLGSNSANLAIISSLPAWPRAFSIGCGKISTPCCGLPRPAYKSARYAQKFPGLNIRTSIRKVVQYYTTFVCWASGRRLLSAFRHSFLRLYGQELFHFLIQGAAVENKKPSRPTITHALAT